MFRVPISASRERQARHTYGRPCASSWASTGYLLEKINRTEIELGLLPPFTHDPAVVNYLATRGPDATLTPKPPPPPKMFGTNAHRLEGVLKHGHGGLEMDACRSGDLEALRVAGGPLHFYHLVEAETRGHFHIAGYILDHAGFGDDDEAGDDDEGYGDDGEGYGDDEDEGYGDDEARWLKWFEFVCYAGLIWSAKYMVARNPWRVLLLNRHDGSMPLEYALYGGGTDITRWLIEECGARLDIDDGYGGTQPHPALDLVCQWDEVGALEYFVSRCPSLATLGKRTLLHTAMSAGSLKVAKFLLERGASKEEAVRLCREKPWGTFLMDCHDLFGVEDVLAGLDISGPSALRPYLETSASAPLRGGLSGPTRYP